MTIEDSTLLLFKPWLLGYCNCGCGLEVGYYRTRLNKFIQGHHNKLQGRGPDSQFWKGGRYPNTQGYWIISKPGYFSSQKNGYVLEHVYVYQEYYKCCMLPWGYIHHIDGNPEAEDGNRIENLEGMTNRQHAILHMTGNQHAKIDMSTRVCSSCGTTKTRIKNGKYLEWYDDHKGGLECRRCHRKKKKKVIH